MNSLSNIRELAMLFRRSDMFAAMVPTNFTFKYCGDFSNRNDVLELEYNGKSETLVMSFDEPDKMQKVNAVVERLGAKPLKACKGVSVA